MNYSNINDFLNLRNLVSSKPFDKAAILGQNLGKRFSRMLSGFGYQYDLNSDFSRQATSSQTSINPNKLNAYLSGVSLSNPIKLLADNGLAYDVFDSTDYSRRLGNSSLKSGQLSDPFTGETFTFCGEQEFKEALEKLEESRNNYLKQRARADLLLASSGSPSQIASIFRATAPTKNGISILDQPDSPEALEYSSLMKSKVYDAIISHHKSMKLSELKEFSSWIPSLESLISSAEAKAQRSGLTLSAAELINLGDIDKKEYEFQLESKSSKKPTLIEISNNMDLNVNHLRKIFDRFNPKKQIDNSEWNPTIDIA
jgi:hypothetical protein